jgi:hypothetical protein
MYCSKKLASAFDKGRPGRIEKLVADHNHAPCLYGRNGLPSSVAERT